jgi:Bacterial EndoU nuclease
MGLGPVSSVVDNVVDLAKDGARSFDNAIEYAKKNVSVTEVGHAALDVVGLVPVVGEAADLANAGWYAAEGNYADAALSAAGAIPFVGWGAATAKGAKYGERAVDAGRTAMKASDEAVEAGTTATKAADDAAAAGKAPEPEAGDAGGPVDPPGGGRKTAGGADERQPDGSSFRTDLPQHLAGPHGWTSSGKLHGTHNQQNALDELAKKGANTTLTETSTAGIRKLEYSYEDPTTGKTIRGSKTVYDPAVYPDSEMLDMATRAGQTSWQQFKADPSKITFDGAVDGVKFRTYINFDGNGNPYIGNVHPIG